MRLLNPVICLLGIRLLLAAFVDGAWIGIIFVTIAALLSLSAAIKGNGK